MGKTLTKNNTGKKAAAVGIPIAAPGTEISNLERGLFTIQTHIKCPTDICKKKDELHSASPDIDISQGGFRTQRSALDQALCLHELCLRHRLDHNNNSPTLAALDIRSAYDTVDHAIIWRALEPTASPPLLGLLQSLFDNVSIQVLLSGTTSRSLWPATGVLQGSILSPHLYSIYINSLPQFLRSPSSSSILSNLSDFQDTPILSSHQRPHGLVCGKWINALLYADDVVLIGDRSNIQQLLNRAEEHSYQLGYRWNPSKCIILQQPTSQNTNPLSPLYLYDQPLPTASTFVYLGIPFNASGMINNQQLLQRNTASALMGMRTLRTIGSIVPFLKKEIQQLEKGQDQCLRYIFGGHAKSSTIVFRHMVNLPTMDERVHTLGVKYLSRAFYLPDDALLTELRPILRDNRHRWKQLQKYNEIWKLLPLPPEDASARDLKSTIRTYRTNNLKKIQQGPNTGVFIKACRPKLGVDPIFFLPMTSGERYQENRSNQTWPKLMVALEQLDKVCHPDPNDDIPADPELGQQFVDWLTPPPPFLPSHDPSLDYILHL
ncbi:hypothetical protein INT45_013689 [Circinella minor]|uniref:Reverse transcriptase domain-containing protein n=1 Tax=Circinella minor TaxID=1195481 RepID=A0A8H7VR01_9FUNG|nr:hypothetical protein INT45_013689 [Circinella minor]